MESGLGYPAGRRRLAAAAGVKLNIKGLRHITRPASCSRPDLICAIPQHAWAMAAAEPPPSGTMPTLYQSRGRDRPCGRPPAQIPACGITALGSYLGCVAAKRASGKGCITRTGGSHRFRIRTIRVQSILVFWLRRRSAFSQYRVTWSLKAATAS